MNQNENPFQSPMTPAESVPATRRRTGSLLLDAPLLSWQSLLAIVVGFAGGWMLWMSSQFFTGQAEPWDASLLYYGGVLFFVSLVSGSLQPTYAWVSVPAIYLGQLGYIVFYVQPANVYVILIVSVAFGVFGVLPSVAGAVIPFSFAYWFKRII